MAPAIGRVSATGLGYREQRWVEGAGVLRCGQGSMAEFRLLAGKCCPGGAFFIPAPPGQASINTRWARIRRLQDSRAGRCEKSCRRRAGLGTKVAGPSAPPLSAVAGAVVLSADPQRLGAATAFRPSPILCGSELWTSGPRRTPPPWPVNLSKAPPRPVSPTRPKIPSSGSTAR